jgi:hypothetical protein
LRFPITPSLKLETEKDQVETIVIERMEKALEN